jgi:hypothetical protein
LTLSRATLIQFNMGVATVEFAFYQLLSSLFSVMANEHIPIRRHAISQLEAYDVTPEELESIKRECASIGLDFQVAQFCITVALTFLIALKTTKIDSDRTYEVFVILVAVGALLGVVFGLKWIMNRGSLNAVFARIESRQIGPVGDEENPLRPIEIANLPPVAAPVMPALVQADPPQPVRPIP